MIEIGAAQEVKLVYNQGEGVDQILEFFEVDDAGTESAMDLTNYSVKAEIRAKFGDLNAVVANFAGFEDATERANGWVRLKISNGNLNLENHVWKFVLTQSGQIPVREIQGPVEMARR